MGLLDDWLYNLATPDTLSVVGAGLPGGAGGQPEPDVIRRMGALGLIG